MQNENPDKVEQQKDVPVMPDTQTTEQTAQGEAPEFEEYQLNVVEEFAKLKVKCENLREFIANGDIFKTLPKEEQSALQAQLFHMEQYAGILFNRIRVWKGNPWEQSKGAIEIGDFGTGNEGVFVLKYLSALMIDATFVFGNSPRRNAVVMTDMEKVQMMAVKSIFSK